MKKVVICGGHLTPAQALIEELDSDKRLKIYFFGRKKVTEGNKNVSAEYEQISAYRVNFINITAGRLQRHVSRYFFISLLKIPVGFIQSMYHLLLIRPSLVVSFGGSLSFPVVFTAWLLGIESVTHEQAAVPGFSNKLNALFVSKIYVAWSETAVFFPKEKTKVIGNLIRSSLLQGNWSSSSISKNKLFIMGGNQGSHFLNNFVFQNIQLLKNYDIVHQVGMSDFKHDWHRAKSIKSKNYKWYTYIPAKDLKALFQKSEFILCRAGANTIWELAIFAKVALLVPLPYTAGSEQEKNAHILQNNGSAIVINQDQADPQTLIKGLKMVKSNYRQMQADAWKLSLKLEKNASAVMAKDLLSMLAINT